MQTQTLTDPEESVQTTKWQKWFKANRHKLGFKIPPAFAWEAKIARVQKRIRKSDYRLFYLGQIEPHQWLALDNASNLEKCFMYKIPDVGEGQKPCDGVYMSGEECDGFFIIFFGNKFYMINYRRMNSLKGFKIKSMDEDMCDRECIIKGEV
jgi:hypothetical protein